MYKNILLLLLLPCLWACQSEQQKKQAEITALETSGEDPAQLLQLYDNYRANYPSDSSRLADYLLRSARLQLEAGRISPAVEQLQYALRNYPTAAAHHDCALLLAELYREQLQQSSLANTLMQALGQARELPPFSERIKTIQNQIFDTTQLKVNYSAANLYITSCELYAMTNPQEEQSPRLLFEAAETARSVGSYSRALELYNWLDRAHPDFPQQAEAAFLKAFTLDEGLEEYDSARLAYQAYLSRWPNHKFAKDAQFLLDNLGKSEQELIQELQ